MSIFIGGFLGIKLYAISPATCFNAKSSIRAVPCMLNVAEFLAYVSPVSKYFSEKPLSECLVFQRFTVVSVSRHKGSLFYLTTVVDYDVQLEAIEPSYPWKKVKTRLKKQNSILSMSLQLCFTSIMMTF